MAASNVEETVEAIAGDDGYDAVALRFEIEPGASRYARLKMERE